MKRQDDMRKRLTTTNDDLSEDLRDWAGKLKALGQIWGALAWHESQKNGGQTITMQQCGESFGDIIQDYAEFIETAVDDNINIIKDHNTDDELEGHQKVYSQLKDTKHVDDIYIIDQRLHKLSSFIQNKAMPAFQLKKDFEEIKKRLMAKDENAVSI